jgi:hypothetical protein
VIAAKISAGLRLPSLELSAGWSTGISAGGQPHPANIINYQPPKKAGAQASPVPPATDPQPHNNMLVSILNMFGIADTRFGHADYCTGPLSGLA